MQMQVQKKNKQSRPNFEDILVIDLETSDKHGFEAGDAIYEIAVVKVNLRDFKITEVFQSLVGHPNPYTRAWLFFNTDLSVTDIKNAPPQDALVPVIQKIVTGQGVTSFNTEFDFLKFLHYPPWSLGSFYSRLLPCLMKSATPVCAIPKDWGGFNYTDYKWCSLAEAYHLLVLKEPFDSVIQLSKARKLPQPHRAMGDALMSAKVLVELLQRNKYNLFLKE